MRPYLAITVAIVAAACGGSSKPAPEAVPGDTHADPSSQPANPTPPAAPTAPEPVVIAPPVKDQPPLGPTIVLQNDGAEDVIFGVTKGWAPVIFAYTGKPPKAKSVILFEAACSVACGAPPDADKPVCVAPETKAQELKMAKTETADPGKSLTVPWDGKVLQYETDKASRKKAKCWRKADPVSDTYTIKACGLRKSGIAGKPSKPICVETEVALAPGAIPNVITLNFPK